MQERKLVTALFCDLVGSTALGEARPRSAPERSGRVLIDEDPHSRFLATRQFRFHHALIDEVAYESVAKKDRVRFHRAVAGWLQGNVAEQPALSLSVAHHLDRAHAFATEVAPTEEADAALVETAVLAQWRAEDWAESNVARSEQLRLTERAVALSSNVPVLDAIARARHARALVAAGRASDGIDLANEVLAGEPSDEAKAHALLARAEAARDRNDVPGIRAHGEPALALARSASLDALEDGALRMRSAGRGARPDSRRARA